MTTQQITWPSDVDAERCLIGCLWLCPDLFPAILGQIDRAKLPHAGEQVFNRFCFDAFNNSVFSAMVALAEKGIQPEAASVFLELNREDKTTAKTPAQLADFYDWFEFADAEHAKSYCQRVIDAAIKRRMIAFGHDLLARIEENSSDAAIAAALATLERIRPNVESNTGRIAESEDAFYAEIERRETGVSILPTPWNEYNYLLGGLRPAWLTGIAAKYGQGKTTLALNLALHTARLLKSRQSRGCVVFFSLEERLTQLTFNLASQILGIDSSEWSKTPLPHVLCIEAAECFERHVKPLPLRIIDTPDIGVSDIRNALVEIARQEPVRLVLIDYIQKLSMPTPPNGLKTSEEWGHRVNANMLEDLAHDSAKIGSPSIVALVQEDDPRQDSARVSAARAQKLSGVPRFCQAIFGACDHYLVFDRMDYHDADKFQGHADIPAQLIIKKARAAKRGNIRMNFNLPFGRITEFAGEN